MKICKAVLDFIEFPVNDKVEFYRYIALQLANTALFPAPEIPLTTINKVIDDFEKAILAAKDGSHSAISDRNDKEIIADELFRALVIYVNKIAKGNETIILKSGFHLSKQPVHSQKAEIAVNDGSKSGDVIVVMKSVLDAVAYKIRYRILSTTGEITEWIEAEISTIAKCYIYNLIPGRTYQFIYASITSAGTSDFCDPVSKIVI